MVSFSTFLKTQLFPSRKNIHTLLYGPVTTLSVVVYTLFCACCIVLFILVLTVNNHFLTQIPARGGSLTEGVIGAPHFINPILAKTDVDKGLVSLVYSGLLTEHTDGTISPLLAQKYTVSPDGTVYTFTLASNLRFDDNKALTSDDVAFTVEKLADSSISTSSTYWQNITVATPDTETVIFTLPSADTTFLSKLTFGILPKHVWQTISDENFESAKQNLAPVGEGIFKVQGVHYQNTTSATVTLVRNTHFLADKALLEKLQIKTYANQSALASAIKGHDIDFTLSLAPTAVTLLDQQSVYDSISTDSTVSLYRSNTDTVLNNSTTVATVSGNIDKSALIDIIQNGYGTPAGVLANNSASQNAPQKSISFSIAVENDPSLLAAAKALSQQLEQRNIYVAVRAFDPGTFESNVSANTFPVILARSDDSSIPASYTAIIPLYTETLPFIKNTNTHLTFPDTVTNVSSKYEFAQYWYTNTNKLWKWFVSKK